MPRKKEVDPDQLIDAVESGLSTQQLMDRFGLKTSAQVKARYVDALMEKNLVPRLVPGRRGRTPENHPADKVRMRINSRGNLIVPRELIEEMGFSEGDRFSVRQTAAGVSLKRLGTDEE
jgi:hypothetical protein